VTSGVRYSLGVNLPSRRTNRLLVTAGTLWLVSAASYLLAEAIAARGFAHYSYLRNFISDLGVPYVGMSDGRALHSTLAPVMNFGGFMLHGILFALAALAVLPALGASQRATRAMYGILLMYVTGSTLLAFVHGGNRELASGLFGLHLFAAIITIIGGNLAVLTLTVLMHDLFGSHAYRGGTIAFFTCALIGAVLWAVLPHGPVSGLYERGCVYMIMGWELMTGAHLLAAVRRAAPARQQTSLRVKASPLVQQSWNET
jgi:hypothetical protein